MLLHRKLALNSYSIDTKPITKEIIEQAKDILIVRRDTHIDSLLDKLNEQRVSQIMDAIISGELVTQKFVSDDIQYCKDLGLLSCTSASFEIANPIYKQIIPAVLASKFQEAITQRYQMLCTQRWFFRYGKTP